MNRHVNAIVGRLSLRAPQRRSLEITHYASNGIPEFAIDAPSIITGNNYPKNGD